MMNKPTTTNLHRRLAALEATVPASDPVDADPQVVALLDELWLTPEPGDDVWSLLLDTVLGGEPAPGDRVWLGKRVADWQPRKRDDDDDE